MKAYVNALHIPEDVPGPHSVQDASKTFLHSRGFPPPTPGRRTPKPAGIFAIVSPRLALPQEMIELRARRDTFVANLRLTPPGTARKVSPHAQRDARNGIGDVSGTYLLGKAQGPVDGNPEGYPAPPHFPGAFCWQEDCKRFT